MMMGTGHTTKMILSISYMNNKQIRVSTFNKTYSKVNAYTHLKQIVFWYYVILNSAETSKWAYVVHVLIIIDH